LLGDNVRIFRLNEFEAGQQPKVLLGYDLRKGRDQSAIPSIENAARCAIVARNPADCQKVKAFVAETNARLFRETSRCAHRVARHRVPA
jgi:hypothetical protein